MKFSGYSVLLLLFTILSYVPSNAQTVTRPKVGVVLSGGGAKGFAHIGFLKAIEEAGIKPDYVTGTSMGAIIGALYSIGYSPDEIARLSRETDWEMLFDNNIRLDQVSFEEKAYFGRYLTELTVKKGKVYLPSALIEGQNLQLTLAKLTQPAHHIQCFDSLPIPFACIAADIETGEPILLDDGNLAEALRASMAIPTVFTPVIREGRVLVDGGLIRNFPVEEVKNMGADIILGNYVGGKFKKRNDLNNFTDILKQSAFITSIFDSRTQSKLCDVYVEPDLLEYGPADFGYSDTIATLGYLASVAQKEKIDSIAKAVYGQEKAPVVAPPITKSYFTLDSISVSGNTIINDKLILGRLQLKKDKTYSIDHIEKRINKAYGTQYFDQMTYALTQNDSLHHRLEIFVKEKPRTNLRVSLHYDTETNAGVLFSLSTRNFLLPSSKLYFEFDFATQPRINLQYFKYIGKRQLWAATGGIKWTRQSDIPALNFSDEEALYNANYVGLYLGGQTAFSSNFTLGMQMERNLFRYSPRVNPDTLISDITEFNYAVNGFWQYNSTDHLYFPYKGIRLDTRFTYRFSTEQDYELLTDVLTDNDDRQVEIEFPPYNTFRVDIEQHFTFFKKFTLTYFGHAVENFTEEASVSGFTFMGGVNPIFPNSVPFYGEDPYKFIADDVIIIGGKARMEVAHKFYVTGILNIADTEVTAQLKAEDPIPIQFGKKSFNTVLGGALELSYDTFIGPVRFAAMRHNKSEELSFYFGLGFNF